ncbi:MAG: hypothetical protein Q9M15_06860 [Mariprofundaceae bacterium]|nr:hypothetical protein [Mariprofundaceae bacterium]
MNHYSYQVVCDALRLFAQRDGKQGLCVAVWFFLKQAGWLGDLSHRWHGGQKIEDAMLWHANQRGCLDCAKAGVPVSSGLRKGMHGSIKYKHIRWSMSDLKAWQRIIALLLNEYRIKISENFL